ncbi:MAG: two-component system, NarL family, sensor histidine kinase DegS [Clostridia bacterium]|nr:two-component system, NarL family, sensor histidine kinase DegS [Clostridia bacterium]MDN5323501.1 two-component system, NarL family, sensor histidine kinase DegS [Clostridia bacterium]
MKKKSVLPSLEEIIEETIKGIENSKSQIFDIAENARTEAERIMQKLETVKKKVVDVINELDRIERLEKAARIRLMEVSRDLKRFTEEDIRKAYLNASNLQAEVKILRNREAQFKEERTELERQYKRQQDTVAKAEQLVSHVGVALDYLMKNIEGLNNKLEEIEARGNLGSRIIRAQEEERRRVAREIHDGPAQSMANIVLRAEFCERLIDKDVILAKKEIRQLKELVRNSLKDVRKIIYDLRPMALDDLGLIPAVTRYIEEFVERFGIKIDFLPSQTKTRLPNTLEVAIFRIIQEALQNVQKHSEGKKVKIDLNITETEVNLYIEDDGKGFKVSKVLADKDRDGYGLLGMRERVELLNGQFNILSESGKGTSISINIPIQSPEEE